MVLINGFTDTQMAWIFQRGAFRKYFQVITFDNRGVGGSDKPIGPYSTKMMAHDTIGLMDHLGIEKAHVLSVSMGGMIAQEIAINYPDRVNKLVLGCTSVGGIDSPSPGMLKAMESVGPNGAGIGKLLNLAPLMFNKRAYRIILTPLSVILYKLGGIQLPIGQFVALLGHDTLDRLHTIKAPTLVITGSDDRIVVPRSSDVLASKIPNAKLVKVEGGSHCFFVEMRNEFNKEVLDFLRGS